MQNKKSKNTRKNLAAKFQYTTEMSPEAIFWLDRNGQFSYVNEQACKSLGYQKEELLSLFLWDIDPDYPPERWESQWGNLRKIGRKTFETKHRRKDGFIFPVEVCACQITFEGNEFHAAYVRDITDRKKAADELIKYRDKLQTLVDEQTIQLKNAHIELLQKERLATLGKLTATVSHELRNPLGALQLSLSSIEDSLEFENPRLVEESVKIAERSINRCVNIIEDLTNYTRIKKLQIADGFLDNWLKSVIDEQPIPEEINCKLHLSCNTQVSFDQEKLRQVIINLIENGVHALLDENSQGKLLNIRSRHLGDMYEIRIIDDGVGISADILENIYEPLYSTKDFGLGLGMAIVKNIVELHFGEIHIESVPGKGTTVILRLPVTIPTTSS